MVNRTPMGDLEQALKDPEFAAYFANAQAESAQELLDCGIYKSLTSASHAKAEWSEWNGKTNYTETHLSRTARKDS